jgi:hypothetical protein
MRTLALYLVCSAPFAATLPGRTPIYPPRHSFNTIAYSSDLRYCVEVHQPAGIDGCLIPQGRSEEELTKIAEANDKRPLKQQLDEFDERHRTVFLFRRNRHGAFVRILQFQVQPTTRVAVSLRGDMLILPIANDIQLPKANIDLFDARGIQIARVRLDQLLTEADLLKAGYSPRSAQGGCYLNWSVRLDDRTGHRIIVLSFDVEPMLTTYSLHKPRIETVEYDADARALLEPQRNHF